MSSCNRSSSSSKSNNKNKTQGKTDHHVKSSDASKSDKSQVINHMIKCYIIYLMINLSFIQNKTLFSNKLYNNLLGKK